MYVCIYVLTYYVCTYNCIATLGSSSNSNSSSSSSDAIRNIGVGAGGTAATILIVIVLIVLVYCYCSRHKKHKSRKNSGKLYYIIVYNYTKLLNLKTGIGIDFCNNKLIYSNI